MLDESEAPMKQISNKEYEKYQQFQTDKLHGRILTPDGLRVVCAGLDNDPEKIGIHMLEMLAKFRNLSLCFTPNTNRDHSCDQPLSR